MRPRHILIALAVMILFVSVLCAIDREISRREKATSPWSVVCDNQGHYTIIDSSGTLRVTNEWSTREEAEHYLAKVKGMFELDAEDHRRFNEIRARKWEACPP